MTANLVIRLLFSFLLLPIGFVFLLLQTRYPGTPLLSDVGLAFVVAGVLSLFHEGILKRFGGNETATLIANAVHHKLEKDPPTASGIRLLSPVRKGLDRYYFWAITCGPQELFFAGRSVLHRIDHDFRDRGTGTAEEVIARKLAEGASIRIMFLDPRSNMIPRLAQEERQTPEQLLTDIATSIGICHRLQNLLRQRRLPRTSRLEIRLYDEVPYFAYHRVDDEVIIGFYFSSVLGHATAAYELVDSETRNFFEGHFLSMFERAKATTLLEFNRIRDQADFNSRLFTTLRTSLEQSLDQSKVEQLLGLGKG